MPAYSYKCIKCSKIEYIVHGMKEEYKDSCECGGKMQKIIYLPSFCAFHLQYHLMDLDSIQQTPGESDTLKLC